MPKPGPEAEARKDRLRLWIQLLRSTRHVEGELRNRLRVSFEMTLPRFDVMAALYRFEEGMLMSELSRYLMVSNGNVTGIIDRLADDGFVERAVRPGDRRASIVSLTREGRAFFETLAKAHEDWIDELLGEIDAPEAKKLGGTLARLRAVPKLTERPGQLGKEGAA